MVKKEMVLLVLIVALLVITGVQAFQLYGIQDKVSSGEVNLGSQQGGSVAAGSSGAGGASSLQNLPTMVGGC